MKLPPLSSISTSQLWAQHPKPPAQVCVQIPVLATVLGLG